MPIETSIAQALFDQVIWPLQLLSEVGICGRSGFGNDIIAFMSGHSQLENSKLLGVFRMYRQVGRKKMDARTDVNKVVAFHLYLCRLHWHHGSITQLLNITPQFNVDVLIAICS